MSTILSNDAFHDSVGHAFNELVLVEHLSRLPADAVLRVLQSIPEPLLRQALAGAAQATAPAPETTAGAGGGMERRAFARRRVLRGGKLIFNNRSSVIDVQLRDLSDGGCRIKSAQAAHLPSSFLLRIAGEAAERRCTLRWRTREEAGVQFIGG